MVDDYISMPPNMVVLSGAIGWVARMQQILVAMDERLTLTGAKYRTSHFRGEMVTYAWVLGEEADELLTAPHAAWVLRVADEQIDRASKELNTLAKKKAQKAHDTQAARFRSGQLSFDDGGRVLFPDKPITPKVRKARKPTKAKADKVIEDMKGVQSARGRKRSVRKSRRDTSGGIQASQADNTSDTKL